MYRINSNAVHIIPYLTLFRAIKQKATSQTQPYTWTFLHLKDPKHKCFFGLDFHIYITTILICICVYNHIEFVQILSKTSNKISYNHKKTKRKLRNNSPRKEEGSLATLLKRGYPSKKGDEQQRLDTISTPVTRRSPRDGCGGTYRQVAPSAPCTSRRAG